MSMTTVRKIADRLSDSRLATPDMVAEVLREAIVSSVLQPGEIIRQDAVAADLSVSKIPVREALFRLQAEGLVRFVRNRGAAVCPLSIAEMREVFEVRKALECLALERSVPRLSEADFAKARYIIEQTAHADAPDALSRLNWDFHRSLFAGLDAGPLIAMIDRANVLADRYIRLHLALSGVPGRSQREHRQILAACRTGDSDKAAGLMTAHLDKAITKLEGYFRKHGLPG